MRAHFAFLFFLLLIAGWAQAGERKPVLVVLSSEGQITLQGGTTHATGFYLTELMGPLKLIVDAGYPVVFANPRGTLPVLDKGSDSPLWLGDAPGASPEAQKRAREEYAELRGQCQKLGVCGKPGTTVGTLRPKTLAAVIEEGLDQYAGVMVPGGHAPMEDLWKDAGFGTILRYFHNPKTRKPTGLICHAPIALLAAMDDPQGYISALVAGDRKTMFEKSKHWIYRDYAIAVFTTREEQQQEPGQDNALGGYVVFYPDEALEKAGAFVSRKDKWQSHAIQHHELITGQNPFSHEEFGSLFLRALEASREKR